MYSYTESLNVLQKLKYLAKESEQELRNMGFASQLEEVGKIYYTISQAKCRWGQCVGKKNINISQFLLELGTDIEIKNTIIHEILHTFKDTKGHGTIWKRYATIINNYGKYTITRVNSIENFYKNKGIDYEKEIKHRYKITCKKCGATWYKERLSNNIIKQFKRGGRIHKICRSCEFIVEDLKNNNIVVNGREERYCL